MTSGKTVRILIVDDHPLMRKGVESLLAEAPDCEICGAVGNGREAIAAVDELAPDIVVMDITMPELNGVEATRRLLERHPDLQIAILSVHRSERLIQEVFAAGARAYILKSELGGELLAAIEALKRKELFFTRRVAEMVLGRFLETRREEGPLSSREREIVQLIAEGKSSKQVAALLGITIKTVETHRAHILRKLGLHSVADLVRYAVRNGMIEC